jgi:hypothetical protein
MPDEGTIPPAERCPVEYSLRSAAIRPKPGKKIRGGDYFRLSYGPEFSILR